MILECGFKGIMLFSVAISEDPSGTTPPDFAWRECSTALRNRQRKGKKGGIAPALSDINLVEYSVFSAFDDFSKIRPLLNTKRSDISQGFWKPGK
jgi:hypothetical protein